jgi:hypothetical protein
VGLQKHFHPLIPSMLRNLKHATRFLRHAGEAETT